MSDERGVAVADGKPLFFSALRDLHLTAGKPSARSISRELGDVSHTTVADMLNGRRLASWAITGRVVGWLGGDEAGFRRLWALAVEEPGGAASFGLSGTARSVSTTHVGAQILGVSSVPVSVAAKDPRAVFTAVSLEAFVGREWLAGKVDRFVVDNPCGYVFIEAEAGLGKTAFAAWLVRTRGYLSHFSRYSGGQSVRAALQNLSAQLITGCGLDDEAPGGMLPDWAQTPGGFETLLGKAALRFCRDGRKLTLVVDGFDEAEPFEEGLPFGLPTLLPDGVFVIGTYRTGQAPLRPESPHTTLWIRKEDPRNRSDIRAFITRAATEEVLAARLAEADVDPGKFINSLADHCDGVWIYLRYVLQELRLGLQDPDAISDRPAGLRDYYSDQIRRWQRDPAWDGGLLPLVATLGVAGEALPASALARLAGDLDPATVRRWCNYTLRPLLTTTRAATAGLPLRYEVYHASFREVLRAANSGSQTGPDDQPYELAALTDELKQATLAAHSRIADTYLDCFGGLDTGLSKLAENPGIAGIDGGYPLRHLARHLQYADRASDLHRLMAIEHTSGNDIAVNVWFTTHDWAEDITSYLEDVARARDISVAATDEALVRHQPAATLGMEIRYDLMAASIASRTFGISPGLLEQALHAGLWSPARGLDHARRLTVPRSRVDALITVHRYMNADEQPGVLAQALTAATAITDDEARVRALTGLAPYLPAGQQAQALAAALAAALAIPHDHTRAEILTGLAPYLPPERIIQALTAATAITDDEARVRALTGLAPYLPAGQQAQALAAALAAALAIPHDHTRAEILTGLAPYLPPERIIQALTAATAITDDEARVRALTGLAPYLPAGQQAQALAAALAAALAIPHDHTRAEILTGLAPYLPPERIIQALTAATAITDDEARVRALTGLAPYLPAGQQAQALAAALAAALAIPHDHTRAEILTGLAPYLPPERIIQALTAATAITDDEARVRALTGLAPYLPAGQQAQALAAALAIPHDHTRAEILTGLAPYLPPERIIQALTAATAITDDEARVRALTGLAPYLPAGQQAQALAAALAAAVMIADGPACARTIAALAPCLPADQQVEVLASAAVIADGSPYAPMSARDPVAVGSGSVMQSNDGDWVGATMVLADGRWVADEFHAIRDDRARMKVLRRTLDQNGRPACLDIITSVALMIARLGGAGTVKECIKAITDVHRWWV